MSSARPPGVHERKKVSKLLLLSMFALASRYDERGTPKPKQGGNEMWEAGCDYLAEARRVLSELRRTRNVCLKLTQ